MTLCTGKLLFQSLISSLRSVHLPVITQVRKGSYTARYLEPTVDREELLQPIETTDQRLYRPIKAARTEQNLSFQYDPEAEKFINLVMRKGNKKLARELLQKAFEKVKMIQLTRYHKAATEEEKAQIDLNPLKIFHDAVENCRPVVYTTRVLRGGIWYEVPTACRPNQKTFKAMKFLIEASKEKNRKIRFHDALAEELIAAQKNEGKSIRKKQELLRRCDNNKAYATYRWT